jgi:phage gp29-like protein
MARLSRVLGPDGRPVDLDELFGEPKAGPSLTGVRQPHTGHPAEGLTPWRLAAIHKAAANGDARTWLELAEDIEERDPHYLSVLGTRRRQVAQLPVTIEAASDDKDHAEHAAFIRDWLGGGVLDEALFDMLDAIGKGYSVCEITWSSTAKRVEPELIEWRRPEWFHFDEIDGETLRLQELTTREPLSPVKFIVHRHKAKSGLTIRSGLARVASWSWMYKSFTAKDWAIFTQNYGAPIRVGRYDRNASETDIAVLRQAVRNIAGDCAAIIPKGMEIEFVALKDASKSGELYEKRADWLDRQISKLVLGQTTTTDAVSGGHAVSQEHRLVQEDIERADAKTLATTLRRQLVPNIIAFNFGPQEKYPRLMIGRPDELPIKDFVNGFDIFAKHGGKAKASEVRNRLGLSEPGAKDEVIGGVRPSQGAPGDGLEIARQLVSRHASAPDPAIVDRLQTRLAEDAAGALSGMVEAVRAEMDAAADLTDLAERLAALKLPEAEFAEAMARGLALAHLAGQAALLDEIER